MKIHYFCTILVIFSLQLGLNSVVDSKSIDTVGIEENGADRFAANLEMEMESNSNVERHQQLQARVKRGAKKVTDEEDAAGRGRGFNKFRQTSNSNAVRGGMSGISGHAGMRTKGFLQNKSHSALSRGTEKPASIQLPQHESEPTTPQIDVDVDSVDS